MPPSETHVDKPYVHRIADPVDARVIPYDFMHRIDHDNFIVLVNRILEKMCYLVKEH